VWRRPARFLGLANNSRRMKVPSLDGAFFLGAWAARRGRLPLPQCAQLVQNP
jgi:hypothetical protein